MFTARAKDGDEVLAFAKVVPFSVGIENELREITVFRIIGLNRFDLRLFGDGRLLLTVSNRD